MPENTGIYLKPFVLTWKHRAVDYTSQLTPSIVFLGTPWLTLGTHTISLLVECCWRHRKDAWKRNSDAETVSQYSSSTEQFNWSNYWDLPWWWVPIITNDDIFLHCFQSLSIVTIMMILQRSRNYEGCCECCCVSFEEGACQDSIWWRILIQS